MNREELLEILAKRKAIITDSHIVYKSGKHGSAYVNKDAIFPFTDDTSAICWAIAQNFTEEDKIDFVIGPVVGGAILSQWVARHLSALLWEVASVFADKEGDGFVIKRGYDLFVRGKRGVVIEDVLNTGGSARQTVQVVRQNGGEVVAVAAICNRGGVTAEILEVPRLVSLLDIKLDMWEESACPLCASGVEINTQVGHGNEFLARRRGNGQ